MEIAIKEISRQFLNEKLLELLKQEIEILKSMNNPHVIRLFDVKKTSKHYYLITEYCNGGDLQNFLYKYKRFEEHVAQLIIWQVSKGLKELSERKILHRDLKLSNLLINYEGGNFTIKIGDFGFARILSEKSEVRTFCGTAPNMAPEILKRSRYREKVDLWSLGTIIFQLITGYSPYEGKSPEKVLQSIERNVYSYPPNITVSDSCKKLIESLLQVDPNQRISWNEFFKDHFVKTDPKQYLAELREEYGSDYGKSNPLELFDPNKKKGMIPVKNVYKPTKMETKVEEEFKTTQYNEQFQEPNNYFGRILTSEIIAIIKSSIHTTINHAEIFLGYLEDNEREYSVQTYEKNEFLVLINLLLKLRTLFFVISNKKIDTPKLTITQMDNNGNEQVVIIMTEWLASEKGNKEVIKYLPQIGNCYLKLTKYLKKNAFMLQEITTFNCLNHGMDNIIYIIDKAEIEEKTQNWIKLKRRLMQCLVILNIVIEEYNLFRTSPYLPLRKNVVNEYVQMNINKTNLDYLTKFRKLIKTKLESVEAKVSI